MAKISTYTTDSNVTLGDKVIGTDVDSSNQTKNFLLSDVLALFKQNTSYGSFYHNATQTVTSGSIAAMICSSTDLSSGVTMELDEDSNFTEITFQNAGVYNIAFSAQLKRTSGGSAKQTSIWLRKNGIDVPSSNTHVTMQSNSSYLVAAWNFFVEVNAGDYAQIMWTQDDDITIAYEAASVSPVHPATPSVIITVNQV